MRFFELSDWGYDALQKKLKTSRFRVASGSVSYSLCKGIESSIAFFTDTWLRLFVNWGSLLLQAAVGMV
jgi:hypothetical protein